MKRFITVVGAVGSLVAQQSFVNALGAIGALELSGRAYLGGTTISARSRAVPFIRPVSAVVLLVAVVRFGDAFGILAGEFGWTASTVLAVAFRSFI